MMILNNERLSLCPCCNSDCIHQLGAVRYAHKTTFANIRVELSKRPELWECAVCKSWFIQNRIFENDAYTLYSKGNSWISKSFEESKSIESINVIETLITHELDILDVGCSNGAFLDFAKLKGANTYGLEYSTQNFTLLNSKGHKAYLSWEEIDHRFDVITAFDLVEHLYQVHHFIDQCYNRLKSGGKLVIVTGNNSSWPAKLSRENWWYLKHPEHIVFPSLNFYDSLNSFLAVSVHSVYPQKFFPKDKKFLYNSLKLLKSGIKNVLYRSYSPLPLLPPDHVVVILEKR